MLGGILTAVVDLNGGNVDSVATGVTTSSIAQFGISNSFPV